MMYISLTKYVHMLAILAFFSHLPKFAIPLSSKAALEVLTSTDLPLPSKRPLLILLIALQTINLNSDISQEHFQALKEAFPGRRLLIVSNSAGTSSLDPSLSHASAVQISTGVDVLVHSTKKPGCGPEIMEYFRKHPETGVTRPEQIAVVGDRLTTDVMMANLMGGYAVWVRDGVTGPEKDGVVS